MFEYPFLRKKIWPVEKQIYSKTAPFTVHEYCMRREYIMAFNSGMNPVLLYASAAVWFF